MGTNVSEKYAASIFKVSKVMKVAGYLRGQVKGMMRVFGVLLGWGSPDSHGLQTKICLYPDCQRKLANVSDLYSGGDRSESRQGIDCPDQGCL
jgi:hypothetical protein